MVNGIDQLQQMRRSRTSLIFLAVSLAGFYYSTQVSLDYETYWWVWAIATVSSLLFIVGIYMSVGDWRSEQDLREKINEKIEAETEDIKGSPETEEEETPAEVVDESEETPKSAWSDIIYDSEN